MTNINYNLGGNKFNISQSSNVLVYILKNKHYIQTLGKSNALTYVDKCYNVKM